MENSTNFADVIILGKTITGIFAAWNLNNKLGNSIDCFLIDQQDTHEGSDFENDELFSICSNIELPVKSPEGISTDTERENCKFIRRFGSTMGLRALTVNKIASHGIDDKIRISNQGDIFDFGNFINKFELKQWLSELNNLGKKLHQISTSSHDLLKITVLEHIKKSIITPMARRAASEIVKIDCSADPSEITLHYYLWIRSRKKIEVGDFNTNITYTHLKVENIVKNESYISLNSKLTCKILLMALSPDRVKNIYIDPMLTKNEKIIGIISRIKHKLIKTFALFYEKPFWEDLGFGSDVFALNGPIRNIMRRYDIPEKDDESCLYGYVREEYFDRKIDPDEIIKQLHKFFGEEINDFIRYEENWDTIDIPALGDFTELLEIINRTDNAMGFIDWSTLDLYRRHDLEGALHAGYKGFLNAVDILRPQAIDIEDLYIVLPQHLFKSSMFADLQCKVNYRNVSMVLIAAVMTVFLYKISTRVGIF